MGTETELTSFKLDYWSSQEVYATTALEYAKRQREYWLAKLALAQTDQQNGQNDGELPA